MVRHGETEWNRLRKIQGSSDIPLNQVGLQQAQRLVQQFKDNPVDVVYASDLSRARQTAEAVANVLQLPVNTCSRLRERHFGELEGTTPEERKQRYPAHLSREEMDKRCGIEDFSLMQQRMAQRLQEIMENHQGQKVLVVSHGGAINGFLNHVTQGEMGPGKTRIDNTSVTHFLYSQGKWSLQYVNNISHLPTDE